MDCCAKYGSMVCAVQSVDCANPYFAPNIYTAVLYSNTYISRYILQYCTVQQHIHIKVYTTVLYSTATHTYQGIYYSTVQYSNTYISRYILQYSTVQQHIHIKVYTAVLYSTATHTYQGIYIFCGFGILCILLVLKFKKNFFARASQLMIFMMV